MTKRIYITGDRSVDPLAAVQIVGATIANIAMQAKAKNEPFALITGDAPQGIESAVRYLVPKQAVKVFERERLVDGKVDFDTQHALIKDDVDEVIFLHTDPLSSTVGKSVAKIFDADKVRYPFQEAIAKKAKLEVPTLAEFEAAQGETTTPDGDAPTES